MLDAPDPLGGLLLGLEHPLGAGPGIADQSRGPSDQADHPVTRALQVAEHDELDEVAEVQRGGRRVEAAVRRDRPPRQGASQGALVGGLRHEATPLQLGKDVGHVRQPATTNSVHGAPRRRVDVAQPTLFAADVGSGRDDGMPRPTSACVVLLDRAGMERFARCCRSTTCPGRGGTDTLRRMGERTAYDGFIAGLPKAELHVHHVGSARPETVARLAERHPDAGVPQGVEALRDFYTFSDFAHFIDVYLAVVGLLAPLRTSPAHLRGAEGCSTTGSLRGADNDAFTSVRAGIAIEAYTEAIGTPVGCGARPHRCSGSTTSR